MWCAVVNFVLMDIFSSLLVLGSAIYGKKLRQNDKDASSTANKIPLADREVTAEEITMDTRRSVRNLVTQFLTAALYFLTMFAAIFFFKHCPNGMVVLQHATIIGFIAAAFVDWFGKRRGLAIALAFVVLWILSTATPFRWLLNNIIVGLFAILASHIKVSNFVSLQIFLWTALVYDVCTVNIVKSSAISLFSFKSDTACETIICEILRANQEWQLPNLFSMELGKKEYFVSLGTGDIVIGCIVANFSQTFFKSVKYVTAIVASFALSIALLYHVGHSPYPALISIVPCCTVAIILCSVFTGSTRKLLSLQTILPKESMSQGNMFLI